MWQGRLWSSGNGKSRKDWKTGPGRTVQELQRQEEAGQVSEAEAGGGL